MRALILVESLVVLALAAGILVGPPAPASDAGGDVFPAARFVLDALPGETVLYRVDEGLATVRYTVGTVMVGGSKNTPKLHVDVAMTDTQGLPLQGVAGGYEHLPTRHGFFPLMAPEAPAAYDRVWVLKRIKREESFPWKGKTIRCWRVDAIDPALKADADAVVMWMHEDCPVFGIFRWQRGGHTYEADWRPPK
jgi:hypothetical protein